MITGVGQATPPIAAVLADVDGTLVPKADAPRAACGCWSSPSS